VSAEELDLDKVKAGDYELVALSWEEPTSKPGQPYDFVTHRQGDKVTLDVEQARRLLSAGAVKPIGKSEKPAKAEKTDATDKPAYAAAIAAITKYVGSDKAKAQEYLDEEAKTQAPRVSLVEALNKVLAAEA
jgi:hypothetical protein